jgi:hypothetical protein
MGMSGDFEVALDYGSTIVRIGTKLFDNVWKIFDFNRIKAAYKFRGF